MSYIIPIAWFCHCRRGLTGADNLVNLLDCWHYSPIPAPIVGLHHSAMGSFAWASQRQHDYGTQGTHNIAMSRLLCQAAL
jgi:hypothetical protein